MTGAQSFVVEPSTIPGVTVSGRGIGQYPQGVDAVLGSARTTDTNAWLPYGVIASNNTGQDIVAVAARWVLTDPSGMQSDKIMARTLFESPDLHFRTGESMCLLPFWVLAGGHPGIRSGLAPPPFSQPSELRKFQNARGIQVTLDGVVFASGQFEGPNTVNEYEAFRAEGTAGYNLASAILARRDAGEPVSSIVTWLQQTAANQPSNAAASVESRDWTASVSARWANRYLQAYNSFGESRLYTVAQQQVQAPHLTIYK